MEREWESFGEAVGGLDLTGESLESLRSPDE